MKPLILTKAQARKIILHAAGLSQRAPFGKGREAVYKLIDHLGFVQIDANYVVERAHHHAIASRVPDYKLEWLNELQADGRIFEFFTSDAGYIPMHDFHFSLSVKEGFLSNRKPLTQAEINLMNRVLDRIAREGPLTVKDFENDRLEASSGWWDWRPSKIALERLYLDGRLMVTRGKDFQKVYDLPMNIIPDDIDTAKPTPEAFARYIIRRSLQSLGIAYVKEMAWRARRVKGHLVKTELEKLVAEGEVCPVVIEGLKTSPLYMLPAYKNKKIQLSDDAFILSPFDVLNVFRHRLRDFFDFDYQIECFVPEAKRKYGYFSLPVLVGDTFVARMDSKTDRKQQVLTIHNLHFEPLKLSKPMIDKIIDAIQTFVKFNQCRDIIIKKSNNKQYLKAIRDGF
ncbi:winged helix-turn-helix domain-containing protein [Pseudoflavitalea sp. X16]|uniref:winged helix-turn-helix domain-containing protein n=1 Tax=Paraflavitalea devenefica TaxID=2716334 RepID=UPI00141DE173|nr:crosslink repair DNA glycosylase YcaQ family protein [Paraflavitalea devenefica]NII29488.1 winged helix-turn-helix domain-containing protein [Paraflavitalea devenefica]